jgi:PAS domain S-box-containing protein
MFTPLVRVLFMQDNESDARILQQRLSQISLQHLDIIHAKELDAAMALLSNESFDVALLDLSFPDDQKIEAVHCIRNKFGQLPIIGLISSEHETLMHEARLNGIRDFVVEKYNDPHAISQAIRFAVQHNRSETGLRQSEEHFKLACENSHAMVYEFDAGSGQAVFAHGLPLLLGYNLEEVPQNMEWWFAQIHQDDISNVLCRFQASRSMGGNYAFRYRVRHKSGKNIMIEDAGRNIVDEKGQAVRIVGSVVDITQRVKAEEALHQSEQRYHEFVEELEHMVEQRTTDLEKRSLQLRSLAAELAHAEERERKRLAQGIHDDLQQLLVGGKFCAETLAGNVSEELRETVQRLNQFLNDAIESTRSLTFELSPPILHNAGLGRSLHYLGRRMEAKYGLIVTIHAEERAEPEDEDLKVLLFQATRELLFNVVKHARVKMAEVEMRRLDVESIQIVVSDAGAGFVPKESCAEESPQGYGLFSIKGRLDLIGGRLEIKSAPGSGTCCTVTAPFAQQEKGQPSDLKALRASMSRSKARGGMLRAGHRIRVLIADEHALMRQGLVRLLQGYRDIAVVGDVCERIEILDAVKRFSPDIIIMDADMSFLNGVEMTAYLKKEFPQVRVIGLSAREQLDHCEAMCKAGAFAILNKSNRLESLITTIRSVVSGAA